MKVASLHQAKRSCYEHLGVGLGMTIGLLMADDHVVVCQTLTVFVAFEPAIELVGEAETCAAATQSEDSREAS